MTKILFENNNLIVMDRGEGKEGRRRVHILTDTSWAIDSLIDEVLRLQQLLNDREDDGK